MSGRGTLTRIIVIQPESAPGQEQEPENEAAAAEEGGNAR
jgi:hypothetical protein